LEISLLGVNTIMPHRPIPHKGVFTPLFNKPVISYPASIMMAHMAFADSASGSRSIRFGLITENRICPEAPQGQSRAIEARVYLHSEAITH